MIFVHVSPRNNAKGLLLPAVFYEKKGVPPCKYFVHACKRHPNQFVNVLKNISFALEKARELYERGDIIDPILAVVTNNSTVVTWFKNKKCPNEYAEHFEPIFDAFNKLPIKQLDITSDIPCLAKSYAVSNNITSSEVDESDEESDGYVSFVTIMAKEG